jgi:hypothetical protein
MKRSFSAAVLVCLALCVAGRPSFAQGMSSSPSDAQVKAAMVYNLAKFVDWPGRTSSDDSTPLTICWLGSGPLAEELQAIDGKLVRNRPVVVRQVKTTAEVGDCQILVLDRTQQAQLPGVLKMADWNKIFTISDIKGFAAAGGMLGFVNDGGKVRFEINLAAVEAANIKVSSQVLSLAVIVKGED